ncbi:MAG: phytoene/squalene synthase family protein, partial [Deltaproteobacteria bacterium]
MSPLPPSDGDLDAVIAHHSKSFAMAARLFPAACRRDATVIYAWCRRADDLVDDGPASAGPERLRALRTELDGVYAGHPGDDPVIAAFAEVVARRGIPRAYPEALLDGMAMDVAGTHYATLADLLRYAYRVASAVGLMMCHVMGVRRDEALVPAARLGLAMQITNICRDVLEDWERGRLYLPADMLLAAGAPPLVPAVGQRWPEAATEPVSRVVRRLLDLADAFYRDADRGLRDLAPRSRLAV